MFVAGAIWLVGARAAGDVTRLAAAQAAVEAPSPQELRQVVERMIANTHRNDAAIAEYERVERWTERRSSSDTQLRFDKTYRVVPTGTGTLKLVLKENGVPVAPDYYRRELQTLEKVLEWALDPEEPRQKERVEKWKRRAADRYQAVEAFRDAYTVTWLGRETGEGGAPAKLKFEPKPGYQGHTVGTDLLSNSRVTVWLDSESQVERLEAELVRDMPFGGGLLGKIYKGGHVTIDQVAVAQDLRLPRTTRYEVKGRKFLFPAEQQRTGEASDYRRVGPPREALQFIRAELARLQPSHGHNERGSEPHLGGRERPGSRCPD